LLIVCVDEVDKVSAAGNFVLTDCFKPSYFETSLADPRVSGRIYRIAGRRSLDRPEASPHLGQIQRRRTRSSRVCGTLPKRDVGQTKGASYVQRSFDGTILGRCACIFEPGSIVAAFGFSVGGPCRQLVRGAAVQSGIRKVYGRFQGPLPLRRRAVVRDAAESLPHVVRRLLQLLLHAKRHSVLQLHVCQLPLQVRIHRRRLLHYLHQRRQAMLQHAAMLLRLLLEVLRKRLLLLCVLQRHADLLRHLLSRRL
jgi:hypothetical protein